MFRSIFNPENSFFQFTGRVLDVVVLSLLWLVCCLPVVTIGPATSALYYSCVKCLRFKEPYPYRSFLLSFRQNLGVGIAATAVFLALALLLRGGYAAAYAAAKTRQLPGQLFYCVYLVLLLIPAAVVSCAFPLLSRFSYGLRSLLANSLYITLRHLPSLLAAAVWNIAMVLLTIKGWYFCVMLLTPALGTLVVSFLLEPIFRRYTPREDSREEGGKPWYLR